MDVPIIVLGQMETEAFEWLVPGLLEEKITALMKGLPKSLRKNFVPAPQFAQACVDNITFGEGSLLLALSRQLKRMTGIYVASSDWQVENLAKHLRMKFNVLDKQNKPLASGTNLGQLQKQYAHLGREDVQQGKLQQFASKQLITRWDFEAIPEAINHQKHGLNIALFPALVDKQTSVSLEAFESEQAANSAMHQGLRRLIMLSLHQQADLLRKNMPHQQELTLYYASIGKSETLREDIISQAFERVFMQDLESYPRNEKDFQILLDKGRAKVVKAGHNIAENTLDALKAYAELQQNISNIKAAALTPVVDDIQQQVGRLIYPNFVQYTPSKWLPHLARFLQAANIRLGKAGQNLQQDATNTAAVQKLWVIYTHEIQERETNNQSTDDLQDFRWLIEELRVSLFAQNLKTSAPVSIKRLGRKWLDITR